MTADTRQLQTTVRVYRGVVLKMGAEEVGDDAGGVGQGGGPRGVLPV
jgi:hypothetical protein